MSIPRITARLDFSHGPYVLTNSMVCRSTCTDAKPPRSIHERGGHARKKWLRVELTQRRGRRAESLLCSPRTSLK
ncbi:MAG TPA: hypothetical protein PKA76_06130 [Pirellulaceae bacterium]|nr:hypothetical protein [Pirellulaceae bacterium]HMP68911.1 hypothetical protein [Pirellulaceae bacterium]